MALGSGIAQRHDFGVRAAGFLGVALAEDPAGFRRQYAADRGIRWGG